MIDGKSFNEEELKEEPLDEEIKKLVYLINKVDGVETIESCFGHHKNPCRIWLRIKNIDTANKFIKKFFYFDRLWSLKLTFIETDDYFDELLFKLESAYKDYPTVDLMVENLTERFEKRIYNTAGMTIEALEQELSRDTVEIQEILNCDADDETKLRMITNIMHSKPHYFKALEQKPKTEKDIKMCDVTPEEREIINNHIKSISKPTGVDFWDLYKEPCEDAVSRQAVLEQTYKWSKDEFLRVAKPFDYLRKRINSLSPINPQPKTGHWEWVQYDSNPNIGNWQCSECRCVVIECGDKKSKGDIPLYKYCPQCGCRIVESQKSEGEG